MRTNKSYHVFMLLSAIGVLIWSIIHFEKFITWVAEALPAIIFVSILVITYKKFTFTNIAYVFIWINVILVLIGAHYTYPKVPFFNWIRDMFNLSRNHYDRFVHFFYGATAFTVIREFFVRRNILNKKKWLLPVVISICLASSTIYELVEFAAALIMGEGNTKDFLAMQGDVWDTQWDITMALIGVLIAMLFVKRYHDKAM